MAAIAHTSISQQMLTATPLTLADQMVGWSMRFSRATRWSDEEDAAYDAAMARACDEVEALPVTRANAVARAKVVMAIHGCDLSTYAEGDQSTTSRLVRQILAALAGDA